MAPTSCRLCGSPLKDVFCDLGMSPASNSFVTPERSAEHEVFYPLKVYVCADCKLVQLPEHKAAAEIFDSDYAYFSSMSTTWLAHAKAYCEMARDRFGLGSGSLVIEIASNDGYLLQNFEAMDIPVLGVEPSGNVAEAAEKKGIPTLVRFFGTQLADELAASGRSADLLVGNNVLAHVPDLNDFVQGLSRALKPDGRITMEFPHLANLIDLAQFDTIYHEHYSYLSLHVAMAAFEKHGLQIYDVEELPTHGGSLRIFAAHQGADLECCSDGVARVLDRERRMGLDDLAGYRAFPERVRQVKKDLLEFLIQAKREGLAIAGYGAAAKGNTLLNYCGIGTDFVDFVADRSPAKQGRLLPGTRIPVTHPDEIFACRPDLILVLPWNLRDEIIDSLAGARAWGARFVVAIPALEVIA